MKDILDKLTQLEASVPEPQKKTLITESSDKVKATPSTLKALFYKLDETMSQKPIPIINKPGDSTTASSTVGFLNIDDSSPAAVAMQDAFTDLAKSGKAEIISPGMNSGSDQKQAGTPATGATMQTTSTQAVSEEELDEKWGGDTKLNPAKKGMFKGKTKAELQKQLAALHKSGPHKKGSPGYTKQQELNFAIRAKSGWKESVEEAHTGDEAEAKFNKYNDKELDHMIDRAYGRSKPGDEHKQKRARQAKNAAYNIMWKKKYNDLDKDEPWPNDTWYDTSKELGEELNEKYMGFEKVKVAAAKGGARDPGAVAASIGRKKYGKEKFQKAAAAGKKLGEADVAPTSGIDTKGAGLGAGRSTTTLEAKKAKPDFLDLDKDGNKKESMKKAASDKQKKAVKENMNNRIQAARLEGKAHGLKGHPHCGKNYDDMEECRAYHEGYKEGLDECHGMGPIAGLRTPHMPATVHGMADQTLDESHGSADSVKNAITHRIRNSHMDLVSKYGIDKVMDAIDDQASRYDGVQLDEIGSSDVSIWVRNVIRDLESGMHEGTMDEGAMDEGKLGKAAAAIGAAAALATGGGIAKNVYDYYKPDSSGYSHADIDRMSGIDSRRSAYDTEQERHGNYTPRPIDEDDMEEGNAFTAALAKTPKGGQFKVGGKTFTDRSNYDAKMAESDFAFEAWDRELNKLLNEGLSVSISKGNQGAPDSVNVNATDAEADKLLALVKQAGLGVFGGDEHSDYGSPEAGRSEVNAPGGIEVVGDHDYMMGIMKKLSGIQGSASDYEDEEGCGCNDEEEMSEATCNECGMMESQCGCHEENMMAPQKPNTQSDHNIVVSEEDLDEFLDVTVAQKGQGGDATGSSGGAGVSGVGATGGSSGVSGVGATGGTATASNSNDNTQSAQSSAAAGGSKSGTGGSTVNEVESEDQMTYEVAEDQVQSPQGAQNPPDNGSGNATNDTAGNASANNAAAAYDATQHEENMEEAKMCPTCHHDPCECDDEEEDDPRFPHSHPDDPRSGRGDDVDIGESFTFESLYKKLAMIEAKESTAEKDDKAEKAAKKVARDIEYDEGHKGKDDNKAERAGQKVKKDIEYDDKEDKKLDEWANDAGPGKSVSDTTFEQDIDFMTKVISGGLNKPKSTGQTTVPVVATQLNRLHSHDTTDINESLADWKRLAGL